MSLHVTYHSQILRIIQLSFASYRVPLTYVGVHAYCGEWLECMFRLPYLCGIHMSSSHIKLFLMCIRNYFNVCRECFLANGVLMGNLQMFSVA